MRNENFVKSYFADGAISKFRVVKFGSDDNHCAQSTARNSLVLGVNASLAADAAEDPVDIVVGGIATVEYGGSVTRGQKLTSDTSGKAIAATDRIYQVVISGGAAGNHTVTGILTTDTLISVAHINLDATAANITAADLTSEFTISAADTINNTGGTATSSDKLLVTYQRSDSIIGTAMISGVSGDYGAVKLS